MKILNKPSFKVIDILCTHENDSNVTTKVANLHNLKIQLPIFEESYIQAAVSNSLHDIVPSNNPLFSNLKNFYDNKFVRNKKLRKEYYDEIKKILHDHECPYCLIVKDTITLDHVLPKSVFKEFAITPVNLVPSCTDCNHAKLNSLNKTIHPYFFTASNIRWLHADIINIRPFSVKFLCKSTRLNRNEIELINSHLNEFNLSNRFSIQVSSEIASYRNVFIKTLHNSSPAELKKHITNTYISLYRHNKNSWKTALYSLLVRLESEYHNILA